MSNRLQYTMHNGKTPTIPTATVEPKKSARLAQKRKQREEAGPSATDDDYYFTPYSYGKSTTTGYGKSSSLNTLTSPSTLNISKSDGSKTKQQFKLSPVNTKTHGLNSKFPQKHCISGVSESSRSPSPSIFSLDGIEDDSSKAKKTLFSNPTTFSPATPRKSLTAHSDIFNSDFLNLKWKEDEDSLDEEKWLDALEAGKLDELDEELRQKKNSAVLTARQRAILEKRDKHFILFDEPEDSSKDKILTEEMLQIKAQKTERRRLLAQAKKENDQKKTVEKLLNKPYSKGGRNALKNKGPRKLVGPIITYIFRKDKNYIVYPPNMEIPIQPTSICREPKTVVCGVSGCNNLKKYSCSKTGVPLCSLDCYKKNLDFNFFSVTDSFDCESTMCETAEYESSIIDSEIFTELL